MSSSRASVSARLWPVLWYGSLAAALLMLVIRPIFFHIPLDHFYYLAQELSQGSLTIDNMPTSFVDYVVWNDHHYLPLGPLPAVLLLPFVGPLSAGLDFGWIRIFFSLLNGVWFWEALRLLGVEGERQSWAFLLFFAGTIELSVSVVPISYYFSHVLTTSFILLAIVLTLARRWPILIGLLLGLAVATRITALFALPFFVYLLWRGDGAQPAKKLAQRLLPIGGALLGLAGPGVLLLLYNHARFDSFFDTGYTHAILGSQVLADALHQGFFSIVHVPKNLFVLFLQGPTAYPSIDAPTLQFPYIQPNMWGMGLFFTSPALIYAFKSGLKSRFAQAAWIAVIVIMIPLVTYYGIGWIQFGFRYALDFLPFLALLAALGLPKELTTRARLLIFASVLINLWGSVWLIRWVVLHITQ